MPTTPDTPTPAAASDADPAGAPSRTVVLVNPRATYVSEIAQKCFPPMHLLYLAATLRQAGFDPVVLDANAFRLDDDAIEAAIREARPLVVGFSLYSDILRQVRDLARLARRAAPDAKVVLGGPHVNAVPVQTLAQFAEVDFGVLGEAEASLIRLCRALHGQGRVQDVPGIVYRDSGGTVRLGPPPDFPDDLDRVPLPARDLVARAYDQKRYYSILVRAKPVDTLFTSRGCPFRCGFCYNFRQKYRTRSPEDVVHELTLIRERGIRDVEICDDTFTGITRRALAVFDLILKEKLDISFRIKSRVDVFTEDLARKARQAGVYLVAFGMESGSQAMLDRMNKRTTVEQMARAVHLCRTYRMMSHSSWIVGYPGETPETVAATVDFIRRHKPTTVNFGVLRPYPATAAYEEARATGTLVGDWHPDAEAIPWVRLPWADEKQVLDDLVKKLMRRVYLTPHYAMSFAGQIARGANWLLARYAWQELKKVIRG